MKIARWVFVLIVILCLGTGTALGWYFGYRLAMTQTWLGAVVLNSLVAQRAHLFYSEGNDEAAHEGLEAYLAFLNEAQAHGGDKTQIPWLDGRGLAFDRMLTLGRLAVIEERRGNSDAAGTYWNRAQLDAPAAGLRDTSLAGVRSVVERADFRSR